MTLQAHTNYEKLIIKTIHAIEMDMIKTAINPFILNKRKRMDYYLTAYRYYWGELEKLNREGEYD